MLLLLQIALGLAFLGYLAVFDAIRGTFIIFTGLALLAVGFTLKLILFVIKKTRPVSVPAVAATTRVLSWKIIRA